jgi:hypothetical protein
MKSPIRELYRFMKKGRKGNEAVSKQADFSFLMKNRITQAAPFFIFFVLLLPLKGLFSEVIIDEGLFASHARSSSGKDIRGDFSISEVQIKDNTYPLIQWNAAQEGEVKIRAFFLLKKAASPQEKGKLICSQRKFLAAIGHHTCHVPIKKYYFIHWGDIVKYHVEICYQEQLVAVKEHPLHHGLQKPDEPLWYEAIPDGKFRMVTCKKDILIAKGP